MKFSAAFSITMALSCVQAFYTSIKTPKEAIAGQPMSFEFCGAASLLTKENYDLTFYFTIQHLMLFRVKILVPERNVFAATKNK